MRARVCAGGSGLTAVPTATRVPTHRDEAGTSAQCRILFPIAVFCICCGAGKIAQCHIVFGITGANWVTLSEPDQPRRTGDRFLGEAFAVASACLAAFARAERAGIPPRGYSFTRVRNVVEAFTPLVANAKSPQEAQKYFDQMMYYVGQAKLPKRKKKRPSYPRAIWGKPNSFPHRRE